MWSKTKIPPVTNPDSVFKWSPVVPRRLFNPEIDKKNEDNFYPNCDVSVWLRSCKQDVIDPILGQLSGDVPKWLKGSLYRNGPGSLQVGNDQFQHLFDSSGLLHRFSISNGQISYQCRFLQSDVYKRNFRANRIVQTEFGTKVVSDPCKTMFERISTVFDANQSDNSMISLYPFADGLYAFGESPIIHRIDKETLAVREKIVLGKHFGIVHHTSHPHVEKDGSVYNLAMSFGLTGLVHNVVRFPYDPDPKEMFAKAEVTAKLNSRWLLNPSYMHTFGITENFFVIVEQPLSLSIASMVKCKLNDDPMIGSLKWFSGEKTRFSVLCRQSGKCVRTFYSEAFFYLHIINQYESNGNLILDVCGYRDPSMLECMYVEVMKNMQNNPNYAKMFRGRPLRFTLPINDLLLDGTFIKGEMLCDLGCETPRINYDRYLGKPYRYFYAISSDVDANNPGTIIKVDTIERKCLTWCEENCYPSEPVFVAMPNGTDEDDGVILSSLVWGKSETNRAGLLVLDAKTFVEIARAEFKTPSPVPKCLHGWFIPKHEI